uniref:Uncharacterized protein n=1 Tax=Rousettus aegyptiacus TaxID=9407 RepID=A0A7J8JFT9_ROUAE|nr:hypothetical protein HJG63_010116 [Rousettus aegyptiacus]
MHSFGLAVDINVLAVAERGAYGVVLPKSILAPLCNNHMALSRSQGALKIMNVSSEPCNISDWLRLEATVKASVYVVTFSFATFITVIMIAIVLQNSKLRKEVQLSTEFWLGLG